MQNFFGMIENSADKHPSPGVIVRWLCARDNVILTREDDLYSCRDHFMNGKFENLSLREIALVAELPRFSSLRAFSRARDIEVAQLTRSLQRIEQCLDVQILERSHSGIAMTPDGERIAAAARRVLEAAQELAPGLAGEAQAPFLTVGTRGFLNYVFSPLLYAAQRESQNRSLKSAPKSENLGFRFRFLDMSPEELKVGEHKRLIHLAIHLGQVEWTKTWESYFVGNLRWSAFVRPEHGLLKRSKVRQLKPEDLLDSDFVGPCYWLGADIEEGNDGFPLPLRQRRIAVQVQSAITAIELARTSDAIVFVPNIVSAQYEQKGMLARLNVADTENCFQPVYLSVRTDVVTKWLVERIMEKMREALE
jgi:DNA-binding transcriptional LysR family regulator